MLQFFEMYSGTELLVFVVAFVLVLLISLSAHEFAHAYMAHKQGDLTPKSQGRLTLNPFAHIDLVGFIMILLVGFGWAKPIEVNPLKFRNYKKGMFLVSIAGVAVNLVFAFICYPLFLLSARYLVTVLPYYLALFISVFFYIMFIINMVLVVFNLLPIYPLDGFRVVETFSKNNNKYVSFMRANGVFILLATLLLLNLFDILSYLILLIEWPITQFWQLFF